MKKISVILVDDHSLVRAGIRDFLNRAENIDVVGEAGDGLEAQQLIKEKAPDLALVDIEMPNMGGIELTKWIRENFPAMKIMILSAYDDDEYVMAVLKAGANGYSLKNTSPSKLIDAITDIAANQAALDPGIAIKVMSLAASDDNKASEDSNLTARELQIMELVGEGKTNKEIGETLFISSRTVQGHLSKIFAKLEVETRTEAAIKAAKIGLIKIDT